MAASSSSALADPSLLKYDVFISFRGETRNSFTSHLYSAFCQKHIKAYIDEVRLAKGDDISRALPKAIEESAISIIIFSENYADSRWCLDELVHILKCKEEKDQIVLPIFYGIDPSHIRHQKGTYAAASVKHQGRFKDEMEQVEDWIQALTRAAHLSGWDSRGKSESVLVQQVVEDVMRKLKSILSIRIDDLKGLVGIRKQICIIESLLCFDSPNVRILGIWGMGGIGKTTLARVVFKCFFNRFEGACFLESVREQSQRKGLVKLEKEVFSKLLGEKDPEVYNPFVNGRLSRTKALLVLDDVDDFEQLERLAGDRDRFGPGSKIIVTSRDLQLLSQFIDVSYEVQALDLNEAFQLFYMKAFKESSCRKGCEDIAAKAVSYTRGNPLALQVLGSYLKSLGGKEWESALEKLKRTPNVEIQKVLRVSYDGLDTDEQDMGKLQSISPISYKGNIKSWQKGRLLGRGSFGSVYEGIAEDGFFIAVKEVSLLDEGNQGKQSIYQLQQEIALLSQFEHENIVQYYGTDKDESKLYIFLELVTKGSLQRLYQEYTLGDTQVSVYTRHILQGLKYIHDRNIIHRDIKCANMLVGANGSVKLVDFGLATASKLNDVKSSAGTLFWMAPEVVNSNNQGYGLPADIWSLGCTVLEMLTQKIPYSGLELEQVFFEIGNGMPPSVPDSLSNDARDFIWKCLQVNPDARPTAAELLNHSFVN